MIQISGGTAPELFSEAWWSLRINGKEEESRNGPVVTMQEPTELILYDPTKRVLFDPRRDANPFFHVMETVWMFAGEQKVDWLEQFNRGYRQYAEDNGYVWGAYGARWLAHYSGYNGENPLNQINAVIRILKSDPTSRRAVIAMWDPDCDLEATKRDLPCNTHIYFRVVNGRLDMTVCNRSNDMVWGALGANIVHMTYLHELVARGSGYAIGTYRVLSNNLHVYKDREDVRKLWNTSVPVDEYRNGVKPYPLLQDGETVDDLLDDCVSMLDPSKKTFGTHWVAEVAWPMHQAYLDKSRRQEWIDKIAADDWRVACREWADRRDGGAAWSPSPTASQDS